MGFCALSIVAMHSTSAMGVYGDFWVAIEIGIWPKLVESETEAMIPESTIWVTWIQCKNLVLAPQLDQ